MFDGVLDILQSIGDFFTSVGSFVVDFITDLVWLIGQIGDVILNIQSYMNIFPFVISAVLITSLTVAGILRLIGR